MAAFPYRTSFWADPDTEPQNLLGSRALRADVVVVGGGFAGMSSAYYLKRAKPELRIVLLEQEHVGFGPSGRNFGAVVPGLRELRTAFLPDVDMEEERFAQEWYLAARGELERRIAEGGIECEYRNEPILMQSLDGDAWTGQQREAEILRAKGTPHLLLDAEAFRKVMDVPYDVLGGIVRTEWRAVQPFKLCRGFAAQLRALGVEIFEGTRAERFDDDGAAVTVTTKGGGSVIADKAVLATNAYTTHFPEFADMLFPRHTHVLATEVLDEATFKSLGFRDYKFVEDAGMTFYYARVYKNRLLFGGGASTQRSLFDPSSVDLAADQDAPEFERLQAEMIRRFPQLESVKIEAAWGGPIDMTDNFAPIIRPFEDRPNLIACFGYSGDGLLNGSISGKFVQGLVLGDAYVDAQAERIRQYMLRS